MSDKTNPVIYRTTRRGRTVLSLKVDDKTDRRIFAEFMDTHLISELNEELSKALAKRQIEYDKKNISYRLRGFVTQEVYDEIVTPEKTYVEIEGVPMHISHLREAVAFAKEKGYVEDTKPKVVVEMPNIKKETI